MTGLPTKTVGCTPIRDAWVLNAEPPRILRNSFQRPWPRGPPRTGSRTRFTTRKCLLETLARAPPRKSSRTRLLLPGNAFQRLWPGGPPRKGSRTRLLLPGNAFQRLWPGGPPRKSSGPRLLLPVHAFQRLWPRPPAPGKAPEQDCYY